MSSLVKIVRTLAIAVGIAAAGVATSAQAQTACGIKGSSSTTPVVYDPFNPSGLAATNISMRIERVNPGGGGKTSEVNFYLKANPLTGSAADGTQIIPLSVSGSANIAGIGLNIFYNQSSGPPTLIPISVTPSGSNRFLKIEFTGNNDASDIVQVSFQVQLPANLDLNAVQNLAFDAFFACKMSGGAYNNQTQTGSFSNAVEFPVTVLSALRTHYAGTALAFGEIGDIPDASASSKQTDVGNHIVVQSSGAYSVALSSQNGFKMKKPGAATLGDEVHYSLKFLGDTRDTESTPIPDATAIFHTCMRAGMATAGEALPIQATLIDGGEGKNPSSTYSDTLTVTITPLIYTVITTDDCGSYTVP